jgi:hypothetical protein
MKTLNITGVIKKMIRIANIENKIKYLKESKNYLGKQFIEYDEIGIAYRNISMMYVCEKTGHVYSYYHRGNCISKTDLIALSFKRLPTKLKKLKWEERQEILICG